MRVTKVDMRPYVPAYYRTGEGEGLICAVCGRPVELTHADNCNWQIFFPPPQESELLGEIVGAVGLILLSLLIGQIIASVVK